LKQLEDENRKLEQRVADFRLDKPSLQNVLSKYSKAWSSAQLGAAPTGKRALGLP